MKKYIQLVVYTAFFTLLLNSCKKGGNDPLTPDPDPDPVELELAFPKKEIRAVWLTTAWGIDWPNGIYTESGQKQEYNKYLDKFKELKVNAIFFQVKAMGDAFYNSPYEPWAVSITGIRGKDPGYDILKYLVDEAHSRGIEFHAWMNPYRIATRTGSSSNYPALHSSVNPDWVVSHEKIQIYNPAVPEVRTRLADIVKDLINKYDVDGIHFDDYFYPDPSSAGQMVSDHADYTKYGQGYSTIEAFRRANVDKAIQAVHDVIVANRPEVVFSVSPAANKDYNYNTLYADIAKWCQEGWVDLLIPQLYQEIGNKSNDFQTNLSIWSQYNYSAALAIGHAIYKFGDVTQASAFQTTSELEKQFDLAKKNKKSVGSALYSAKNILDNKIGITDKLATLYINPGVIPFMGRSTLPIPQAPENIKITGDQLSWKKSGNVRSVIYYFSDLKAEGVVYAVTDADNIKVNQKGYYCVSLINMDNKEGKVSDPSEKK